MKLDELKKLLKDIGNGIIQVQDSITGELYVVDNIEIDPHCDLLIKIV